MVVRLNNFIVVAVYPLRCTCTHYDDKSENRVPSTGLSGAGGASARANVVDRQWSGNRDRREHRALGTRFEQRGMGEEMLKRSQRGQGASLLEVLS